MVTYCILGVSDLMELYPSLVSPLQNQSKHTGEDLGATEMLNTEP